MKRAASISLRTSLPPWCAQRSRKWTVSPVLRPLPELAELLGIKSAAKGIKVQIVDGTMTVDTIITVRYGCSVVAVAKAVQESVTSAVESMTGMGKPIVNVHVSGVAFDK